MVHSRAPLVDLVSSPILDNAEQHDLKLKPQYGDVEVDVPHQLLKLNQSVIKNNI